MKFVVLVMILFLFCGCAMNKSYEYGEFSSSLYSDIAFNSRYEIVYKIKSQNGKEIFLTSPFVANSNEFIPKNVVKLHLGIQVFNPSEEKLSVWIEYKITEIDTGKTLSKKMVEYKTLLDPEFFLSIDLPKKSPVDSVVEFQTMIYRSNGGVSLYKSPKVVYKVKGENMK